MKTEYIEFRDSEVIMDSDESGLFIAVPVALVLKRLPKSKGKAVVYQDQASVEAQFEHKLAGVNWKPWISLNFQQTKAGSRSLSVYAKLLADLSALAEKHGVEKLNTALARCWQPRQASIPYIKTILKNETDEPDHQHRPPVDAAWKTVLASVSNVAACYNKKFADPKIQPVVRQMGGWDELGRMPTKMLNGKKREFIILYLNHTPQPDQPAQPPKNVMPMPARPPKPKPAKPAAPAQMQHRPLKKRKRRGANPDEIKAIIRETIQAGDRRGMAVFRKEYPELCKEVEHASGMDDLQRNGRRA